MEERPERTILVVEDDADAREALAAILRRESYGVLTASDGEEALAALCGTPAPDLILLDMLMPVLDGWAFLKRLRREGPPVPVIVATATNLTREWAESNGCRGFLRKPIQPGALLEEVRRCLGMGGATPGEHRP